MKFNHIEFRLAANADVPQLSVLLATEESLVYVVDEYNCGAALPLIDFVRGPFSLLDEDGHFVIYGFDRRTGLAGKLRIAGEVLQYQNVQFTEWGKTSEALRLYVPVTVPIPA